MVRQRGQVARLVLLHPTDRTLPFRASAASGVSPYWYLPGRAIEAGETALQAVARELREEAGIDAPAIGPVLSHRRGVRFRYRGRRIEQDEWHVLGTVAEARLGSVVLMTLSAKPSPHTGGGRSKSSMPHPTWFTPMGSRSWYPESLGTVPLAPPGS